LQKTLERHSPTWAPPNSRVTTNRHVRVDITHQAPGHFTDAGCGARFENDRFAPTLVVTSNRLFTVSCALQRVVIVPVAQSGSEPSRARCLAQSLGRLIDDVQASGEVIMVTKDGGTVAVLL
jgi:hypothetical protein